VTFGQNGVRPLPLNRFSPNPEVVDLQELPNGKLIVGGRYYQGGWDGGTFVARYDSDTNLDRSFGMQGATRIVYPNGTVNAVVMKLLPDGKILLGGNWTFLGSKSVLARLTPRGRLDSSFGTWGLAMEAFNNLNTISGIGVATDGKLIVAGACGDKAVPSNQRVLMMKYSGAGVREQSLVTDFTTNREAGASDLVLQPDGKVLITGFSQNPTDTRVRLAVGRLIP
jgi:uncharacterized delta-60 repeat protein